MGVQRPVQRLSDPLLRRRRRLLLHSEPARAREPARFYLALRECMSAHIQDCLTIPQSTERVWLCWVPRLGRLRNISLEEWQEWHAAARQREARERRRRRRRQGIEEGGEWPRGKERNFVMDQCLRVLLSMLACLRVLALESHDGAMSAPYTRVCVSARARKHARVLHVEAMLRFVTGTIGLGKTLAPSMLLFPETRNSLICRHAPMRLFVRPAGGGDASLRDGDDWARPELRGRPGCRHRGKSQVAHRLLVCKPQAGS